MKNIEIKVNGKVLTLTVDLSKSLGPSKSGKSQVIASTEGNIDIEGGATIGLNVYRKI
jgi:hypothetical protein